MYLFLIFIKLIILSVLKQYEANYLDKKSIDQAIIMGYLMIYLIHE